MKPVDGTGIVGDRCKKSVTYYREAISSRSGPCQWGSHSGNYPVYSVCSAGHVLHWWWVCSDKCWEGMQSSMPKEGCWSGYDNGVTGTKCTKCNGTGKIKTQIKCKHNLSTTHWYCTHNNNTSANYHD